MEKVVRVFDSFEAADAADSLSRAQMTPQQRGDIFFELRERAHSDAFKRGFARVYRVLEREQGSSIASALLAASPNSLAQQTDTVCIVAP